MFSYAKFVNDIQPTLKEDNLGTIHSIGPKFCAINTNRNEFILINLLTEALPSTLIKRKQATKGQRKYTIIQRKG